MKIRCSVPALSIATCAGLARAQVVNEGFEGSFPPTDWAVHNQSSPQGLDTWAQRDGTTGWAQPRGGLAYARDWFAAAGAAPPTPSARLSGPHGLLYKTNLTHSSAP